MKVLNNRFDNQQNCCLGHFSVDDFVCGALEPSYGKNNVLGFQAIEPGRRVLVPYWSGDFGCVVPVMTMNLTTGVNEIAHAREIHWGNSSKDTKGCTIMGVLTSTPDWVSSSHYTWRKFMKGYFLLSTRTAALAILQKIETAYLSEGKNLNNEASWQMIFLQGLENQVDEQVIYEIQNNFNS